MSALGDETELLHAPNDVVREDLANLGRSQAGEDVVGRLGLADVSLKGVVPGN